MSSSVCGTCFPAAISSLAAFWMRSEVGLGGSSLRMAAAAAHMDLERLRLSLRVEVSRCSPRGTCSGASLKRRSFSSTVEGLSTRGSFHTVCGPLARRGCPNGETSMVELVLIKRSTSSLKRALCGMLRWVLDCRRPRPGKCCSAPTGQRLWFRPLWAQKNRYRRRSSDSFF